MDDNMEVENGMRLIISDRPLDLPGRGHITDEWIDLSKLRLASYMARLMGATLEGEDRDPEWHRLISGALDYLCRVDASAAILRHFEKRLAGLHGLCGPTLTPYQALLRHFRHLPAGRDELLRDLNAT